jgi:hypothetical protein
MDDGDNGSFQSVRVLPFCCFVPPTIFAGAGLYVTNVH